MMYAIHDDDGRIVQGNQVYHDDDKIEAIMSDLGQHWIKSFRPLVSPEKWRVDLKTRRLRERKPMPITVSATTIRAGTSDAAIFRNIPKGTRCTISAAGSGLYDIVMDDDELELGIPVPCTYRVKFSLWPAQDAVFDIAAVAP